MKPNFIAVVVCALVLQGCATLGIETCSFGATRCRGNTVQVCKSGLGWSDSISCDDVTSGEGAWTCGAIKGACVESFQCVPVPEKSEPAPKFPKDKGDKKARP